MEMNELRMKFIRILPNVNICTPYVENYFQKGKYIIELSTGGYNSLIGGYSFGVTVVNAETETHCYDLCHSFTNRSEKIARAEAMEYIESFN